MALNPLCRIFLNFAKKNASDHADYNSIIKNGGQLKLRVFLAGHIVAMVTYCGIKLTVPCSPMIGQFFDTMILVSTDIELL